MKYGDYQLRYAAGTYWLLNTEQRGTAYVRPLALNASGAYIWRMLCDGFDKTAIVDRLCAEYGLAREAALKDVEEFSEQLRQYGAAD